VHCAVGYLIADSGASELARAIDVEYEYAYVHERLARPRAVSRVCFSGPTGADMPRSARGVLSARAC
jgi:hypothetical protein